MEISIALLFRTEQKNWSVAFGFAKSGNALFQEGWSLVWLLDNLGSLKKLGFGKVLFLTSMDWFLPER